MRILHLDSGREMRGGQWQVLRLLEGLRAAGHDVTLLARAGAPLAEAVQQARCVSGHGWLGDDALRPHRRAERLRYDAFAG